MGRRRRVGGGLDGGWAADGSDGFVYTTDWEGRPVVQERMHWVLTEAIATSTVLISARHILLGLALAKHFTARSQWLRVSVLTMLTDPSAIKTMQAIISTIM